LPYAASVGSTSAALGEAVAISVAGVGCRAAELLFPSADAVGRAFLTLSELQAAVSLPELVDVDGIWLCESGWETGDCEQAKHGRRGVEYP